MVTKESLKNVLEGLKATDNKEIVEEVLEILDSVSLAEENLHPVQRKWLFCEEMELSMLTDSNKHPKLINYHLKKLYNLLTDIRLNEVLLTRFPQLDKYKETISI